MAIPKHNEMYKEFLDSLSDGEKKTSKEIIDYIIKAFDISEEDQKLLIPSGKQTLLYNRTAWTKTYLKKAGLIEIVSNGRQIGITALGKKTLIQNKSITDETLKQFDSFVEYKYGKSKSIEKDESVNDIQTEDKTPEELLVSAYENLNRMLAADILEKLKQMDEYVFESKVRLLLKEMGYGEIKEDTSANKKSGDEGLDGIIKEDKLGFDIIGIQAKRFADVTVGRKDLQSFVGALAGQGATKGVFVTTSKFTSGAIEYAKKNLAQKIVLIDGDKLAELMIEYNLGVSTKEVYKVKEIDTDFFEN